MLRSLAIMPTATLSFFEIPADDPARVVEFFAAVFGWESLEVPWEGPRYVRLLPPESSERPGGGVLARDASGLVETLTVMIRIEGETLEDALARIERHGGRTALQPFQIGHSGRFARFTDPAGNSFGLWQPLPKPAP